MRERESKRGIERDRETDSERKSARERGGEKKAFVVGKKEEKQQSVLKRRSW